MEAIQTVEYLRSFLLGRTAWSRLHAMLFISGAFGVFRRDIVTELGGAHLPALSHVRDLGLVALGAVAENVGFRQIHAWWRLRGIATAVTGRGTTWSHVAGEGQHAPAA